MSYVPVVKFGEPREPPKQTDVELADAEHGPVVVETDTDIEPVGHSTVIAGRKSHDALNNNNNNKLETQPRPSTTSARSGIAPAAASSSAENLDPDDAPGCSICTENFELGQDLRVLPCDHQFHPACIDPWLLNVSGTCPLCRIDLNPARSGSTAEPDGDLPPPIDEGATTPRQRIGMRQSFLIGLGLGRVHHNATGEDRLAAVQRMRAQIAESRERQTAEREAAAAAEPTRRRRFRERFGIRTRRTGEADAPREERSDVDADATAGAERQ